MTTPAPGPVAWLTALPVPERHFACDWLPAFPLQESHRMAGWLAAVSLPESPGVAAFLLIVILAVTYALLTAFIRIGVPPPAHHSAQPRATGGAGEPRDPAYAQETVPSDEELFAEPAAGVSPAEYDVPAGSEAEHAERNSAPPEYVREPLAVESVRVRDTHLALGDTASHVMTAFRPGENETVPMVQRDPAGVACYVSRTYRVGRRPVTIVLEREDPQEPLRLVRIEVGA